MDRKKILPFSGTYHDIEPFFTPDGIHLFFASNRPIYNDTLRSDYNIWFCTKEDNQWVKPTPLDSIINQRGDEFFPAVTNSGNLYFTSSNRAGIGLEDIFKSEYINGLYEKPVALDSNINSKSYEFNAFVNPEENLIIYSSYGRTGGNGGGDLYFSKRD